MYMVDLTATDRYLTSQKHRDQLRGYTKNPRPGWEFRESWKKGGVTFYRFSKMVEAATVSDVCDAYAEEIEEVGLAGVPITAQWVAHDLSYDVRDLVPYRYAKARPRGRASAST
jgi:hypothetical protein